jgi:hypothetical protein
MMRNIKIVFLIITVLSSFSHLLIAQDLNIPGEPNNIMNTRKYTSNGSIDVPEPDFYNFRITSPGNVTMTAVNTIYLEPGFVVNTGGYFLGQIYYQPSWDEVRLAGCSNVPLAANFGDINVTFSSNTITTTYSKYIIYPSSSSDKIECYQRINPDGSSCDRKVLTIQFYGSSNVLYGYSLLNDQYSGYKIFGNSNILFAIHSDGTLWVYVSKPGESIKFTSNFNVNYDVGGGYLPPYTNEDGQGKKIRKLNWLVMTDSSAQPDITGGFGVYTRPAYRYQYNTSGDLVGTFPKNYYSQFYASRVKGVPTAELKADSLSGKYKSQTSFIVSIFPNKDPNIPSVKTARLNSRITILRPSLRCGSPVTNQEDCGQPNPLVRARAKKHQFPSANEIRSWVDTSLDDFNQNQHSNQADRFSYWHPDPADPNHLNHIEIPTNIMVLMDDMWTFANEPHPVKPTNVDNARPSCFIPYKEPYYSSGRADILTPNQTVASFLASVDTVKGSVADLDLKVLLYTSALSDYTQIDSHHTADEYYDIFMDEIERLYSTYAVISGIYIDTLPLDGDIDKLEPMVLAYRIMRDLKRLYPEKMIILHSSENPIGPTRLRYSMLHREYETYVQWEIIAPFIDRYADVIIRGEAYPIMVKEEPAQFLTPYIAAHIKYIVDPTGKSNSGGILLWTRTSQYDNYPKPFDYLPGDIENPRNLYYVQLFPIALDNALDKLGKTYEKSSWRFRRNPSSNSEICENRILICNQLFDTYYSKGRLTHYSEIFQGGAFAEDWCDSRNYYHRPFKHAEPGPEQAIKDNETIAWEYGPFASNDNPITHYYYRSVPVIWNSINNIYSLSKPGIGFQEASAQNALPIKFELYQNYPNPFNPITHIKFDIVKKVNVKIVIYNVLGQKISVLIDQIYEPGYYDIQFNGNHWASGLYFYEIQSSEFHKVKKMMLIK